MLSPTTSHNGTSLIYLLCRFCLHFGKSVRSRRSVRRRRSTSDTARRRSTQVRVSRAKTALRSCESCILCDASFVMSDRPFVAVRITLLYVNCLLTLHGYSRLHSVDQYVFFPFP